MTIMPIKETIIEILPLMVKLRPVIKMTDDQFFEFCQINGDLRIERTAIGDIIIMPPTGGETGNYNAELTIELGTWNRRKKLGVVFDSNTGFKLPIGSNRSPDVSWIQLDKWNQLTPEQKQKFPPIAPDFVIELMSPTDNLKETQAKMQEYMDSGVRLGWLIYRLEKRVEIYRQGQDKEVLINPQFLSGEDVLPQFVLDLSLVW
jgi:Uma2 family endonuclease